MKKKQVWRYYCEFCKKSGCSGGHMKAHELTCTANPNRECRMCGPGGSYGRTLTAKRDTAALVAILATRHDPSLTATENREAIMDQLREAANGCPACILAAIRQSNIQAGLRFENLDGDTAMHESPLYFDSPITLQQACLGFDFKAERDAYLEEKHMREDQR